MFLYIYPSPIHKSVQKNGLNILVVPLNIIEGPPIPFFPNGPHQVERGRSPSFLSFFAHKRTMTTQDVPFHRGVHHPLHPKKGEDQKPLHSGLLTKQKKVIYGFLLIFTQKASVGNAPTESLQTISGEQPTPSRLPTKEASPNWNPRCPISFSREGGFDAP